METFRIRQLSCKALCNDGYCEDVTRIDVEMFSSTNRCSAAWYNRRIKGSAPMNEPTNRAARMSTGCRNVSGCNEGKCKRALFVIPFVSSRFPDVVSTLRVTARVGGVVRRTTSCPENEVHAIAGDLGVEVGKGDGYTKSSATEFIVMFDRCSFYFPSFPFRVERIWNRDINSLTADCWVAKKKLMVYVFTIVQNCCRFDEDLETEKTTLVKWVTVSRREICEIR